MEYIIEEIQLLKIQVELQKLEKEVEPGEVALRASYAEVSAMTTVWPWRVSAMHEALRLLHEERKLQACGHWMNKWFYSRARREETRRGEGDEHEEKEDFRPSCQHQQCDPRKAKNEPQLVDLHGAGGKGAGTQQQLLQRPQLPQSPHLQGEQQSEDCCACVEI